MAIKAWPYGGKPGIAVAKETQPRLLTVWPLKLWGAVAPVARRRAKSEENQGKTQGQKQSVPYVFCSPRNLYTVQSLDLCGDFSGRRDSLIDSHRQGLWLCSNVVAVNAQLRKYFQKSTVCISYEPLNIQFYIKSISHEQNITPFYSLSITAAQAEPSGDCSCSAHHISFVRR